MRRGKEREAAALFLEILASDGSRPEPCLRLAECYRATGEPASAEKCLREALEGGLQGEREIWDLWFSVAASELSTPKEELLGLAARAAENDSPGYPADLRWALQGISAAGVLRWNCGGDDYRASDGTLWGKDRFALGGKVASSKNTRAISGTEDDALYQTRRWFPAGQTPPRGYRVPLLPGRYRVILHFAEVRFRENSKRRFHILLEGKTVRENYEPKIDEAEALLFEVRVEDGHLDIDFIHEVDNPKISAIEIVALR
jgi:hypothetical protein